MSLYFLWWVMKISESSSTKGNYTRPFELRIAVVTKQNEKKNNAVLENKRLFSFGSSA